MSTCNVKRSKLNTGIISESDVRKETSSPCYLLRTRQLPFYPTYLKYVLISSTAVCIGKAVNTSTCQILTKTASPFTASQSMCYNISWLEAVTSWSHGGLSFIYVFKFLQQHMNDAGWDSSLTFISDSYSVMSLYIACCAVYQVTLPTQVWF